jgi:hypothetical protein
VGRTSAIAAPHGAFDVVFVFQTRAFIAALNEDPITPGPAIRVSFYGEADSTVPNESSFLEGAENESFPGVEHSGANGLLEAEAVYLEVRRVLGYAVP